MSVRKLAGIVFATSLLLCPVAGVAQTPQPGWIADARTSCRVWNPIPQPNETITWSGSCQNGLAMGRGVLQWFESGRPSERYEGEYRDGKQSGRGVYTWPDGDRYEGEWRDDKASGRGVETSANGDRYDGEWRDGKPNGIGQAVISSSVYNGFWTNGCFKDGNRQAAWGVALSSCP